MGVSWGDRAINAARSGDYRFQAILVSDERDGTFISIVGKDNREETWAHVHTLIQLPEECDSSVIAEKACEMARKYNLGIVEG